MNKIMTALKQYRLNLITYFHIVRQMDIMSFVTAVYVYYGIC